RLLCLAAPALVLALSLAGVRDTFLNILCVALGLGLVIFFHELGHFAVAKWCNVHVERFSIGFGPILWARKWGETEYALSAIPFGGYVKMLGQDDMDPSQLTSDEIAQDPRSYSAKPVWQRMAIISAGVTMNILTAILFFAGAYGIGVTAPAPIAGGVTAGGPAWRAGLQTGDTITMINGKEVTQFPDVTRAVVLSNGPITIEGVHPDGEAFDVELTPDRNGTRREIGLEWPAAAEIAEYEDDTVSPVLRGSPAAQAKPPLEQGDRIVGIDGEPLDSFAELQEQLARKRAETITFNISRGGGRGERAEQLAVEVGPNKARTLGARVEFGRIVAVQKDSVAWKAGIEPGDRINRIDGEDVGRQIDPLQLPYLFGERAGRPVELQIQRDMAGSGSETITITVTPEDRTGWTEQPTIPGEPLSVPAIGIAFHLAPRILSIAPGGPAEQAGLKKSDLIETIRLVLPKGVAPQAGMDGKPIEIVMNDEKDGRTLQNFAYAFAAIQRFPERNIELTVREGNKSRTVTLTPWSDPENTWYVPTRGFRPGMLTSTVEAQSIGHALSLGATTTKNTVIELYLTLRNLITLDLSFKELRGPIGIAEIAYKVAEQGFGELLLFLGILSVNLAVLNFLPIPVLDGGHMVFLIWEAVTRRKPTEQVVAAATYAGMLFILGLMGTVIYLDLFVHKVFRGDG
ncbi:MAG: RIP metalloprotease RseP, partial [Planctomycetaceae bacterium]